MSEAAVNNFILLLTCLIYVTQNVFTLSSCFHILYIDICITIICNNANFYNKIYYADIRVVDYYTTMTFIDVFTVNLHLFVDKCSLQALQWL